MLRRHVLTGAAGVLAPAWVRAQSLGRPRVRIAIGGRHLLFHLPLTIAEQLGYFRAEGLDVQVLDFDGGSRAMRAVTDGSADVGGSAFVNTLNLQRQGQRLRVFVVQGRTSQIVLGIHPRAQSRFGTFADLKGWRIGVTALDSSTHGLVNLLLARAGLRPGDVSIVGVGSAQGAAAALRSGQVDALSNFDPLITLLQRSGELTVVADTREPVEAEKLFGGPLPGACLSAPHAFIDQRPEVVQALTNALVRALRWARAAGAKELLQVLPERFLLGDRAVYIDAFLAAKRALSPDGLVPAGAPQTALRSLASVYPTITQARLDLRAMYTNDFAKKASAQAPGI
jgi:NitT/TauT family transport system substrate-binding protein